MMSPERQTVSLLLPVRLGRVGLVLVLVLLGLMVTVGLSPVSAQSASPETRTNKSEAPSKKIRRAGAGQTSKAVGAKARQRARGTAKAAQPVPETAAPSAPESSDKTTVAPQVKTAETVDFDTDADDVQKREPGLDLIQAAPRPARHRSLVPASPSPEDSVVNRP
jgi:hypothetical protein